MDKPGGEPGGEPQRMGDVVDVERAFGDSSSTFPPFFPHAVPHAARMGDGARTRRAEGRHDHS
eukprot:gene4795-32688_t